jgi:uroporphyrinogen-III decarboxylase
MKTVMIKRSLFFFSLIFLMSGSFSFAQMVTTKENQECIQVLKSSKEYKLLQSKLKFSDSEIVFSDISTDADNNNCDVRMHTKSQPDVEYHYLIDVDSKTVKQMGVDEFR